MKPQSRRSGRLLRASARADDPWNAVSGSTLDFIYSSYFLYDACNVPLPPGGDVLVSHGYVSGVGVTSRCVSGTTIFKAAIALDRDTTRYTGSSTSVP